MGNCILISILYCIGMACILYALWDRPRIHYPPPIKKRNQSHSSEKPGRYE